MYLENPASIAVLPAVNRSTAADAPMLYSSTIAQPLANAGYYVMPMEITTDIIRQQGVHDGAQLLGVSAEKFGQLFQTDAVLYVTINRWDTNYYVLGGNVTVALAFELKSTRTNEILWAYDEALTIDTSDNANNSGGLLGAIIATAIKTAMQDYTSIAKQVNNTVLRTLPVGKYHPAHQADQGSRVVSLK
jgi:hypothetical protein